MRPSLLAGALLLAAPHVFAAPPSPGEVLFREGRAAMNDKDYDRACAKFAESQKKEPAPGTALNLGECEERRGHLVAASEAFTVAASTFTSADKQRYATSRAEAMDRRVPRLTVRASVKVAGLSVRVGARPIAVDTETKMDPGDVQVHAEAPGYLPKDLKASLREGKSLEIDIGSLDPEKATSPKAAPPAALTRPAPKKRPGSDLRTAGLVVGGVGVASLVVGGITGILALGHASTVEEHCDGDLACDQEGLDAAKAGDTTSLVSTITVIAGGAALVAGGALFYLGTKKANVTPTANGVIFRATF